MAIRSTVQPEFEPLTPARQEPRHRTLFVVGKLTRGTREHVCRVRNISDGGVAIEHDAGLAVGDGVTIELRCLSPVRAIVRWVEGRMAGLSFAEHVQLHHDPVTANGHVLRSPRFAVRRPVALRIDGALIDVALHDIALGGVKVATGGLTVGSPATIILHRPDTVVAGRICWTSTGASGVQFNAPLTTGSMTAFLRGTADA